MCKSPERPCDRSPKKATQQGEMSASNPIISSGDPATVRRVTEALHAGRLVGLPTETVYGIAALLTQRDALEQLTPLRGRRTETAGSGWVWHVADRAAALAVLPDLPLLARRLMRKAWPGPVALQVPATAADCQRLQQRVGPVTAAEMVGAGHLTLRCPEDDILRAILASVGDPVTVISAAGPAGRAAEEAADISPRVRGHLALLVDGGRTRYRHPSTLVRIEADAVRVLREGAIAERFVQRMADQVVLFVCSGNTCRSPLAAGLAARLLAERLGPSGTPQAGALVPPGDAGTVRSPERIAPVAEEGDSTRRVAAEGDSTKSWSPGATRAARLARQRVFIESAGLAAMSGATASAEAVRAAQEMGVDISAHRSRLLTDDLLRRADLVYTMTEAHRREILERWPGAAGKTFRLDAQADIADPVGGSLAVYRQTARRLEALLRRRLEEMWL